MRSLFRSPAQLFLLFFTIAISLLGAWFSSSVVFYIVRTHTWLSVLVGMLMLPITPLLLQIYAERKRRVGWKWRMPFLVDRALKRSLTFNLILITALLVFLPQVTFTALSNCGDWMLGNVKGENIQWIRKSLHQTAGDLKSGYTAVRANLNKYVAAESDGEDPAQEKTHWPWRGQGIHPAVANMPPEVETNIASVADYIARKEPDPVLRIKALHDYVADRIAYDAPAFLSGQYTSEEQTAEVVFRTRKAVCYGYASLLEALGRAMNLDIIIIPGDARPKTINLSGQGHAWNAVNLKGHWYLLDATWDSGYVDGSIYTKHYRTDYLMPPPAVLIYDHFPSDPDLQFLSQSLTREQVVQMPVLEPKFFAEGLHLISPIHAQTDVDSVAEIKVENPKHRWLLADYTLKGSSQQEKCGFNLFGSSATSGNTIACQLPHPGTYEVSLFSSDSQFNQSYEYIGKFEFNRA